MQLPWLYRILLVLSYIDNFRVEVFNFANYNTLYTDDPRVMNLMDMWGPETRQRQPIGVIWFATFLVFLGTVYGTKRTYQSSINSFHSIFALLGIQSPFKKERVYPKEQIDIFMALATMASYKAASTCRVAKSAAEDSWLMNGNTGPIVCSIVKTNVQRDRGLQRS